MNDRTFLDVLRITHMLASTYTPSPEKAPAVCEVKRTLAKAIEQLERAERTNHEPHPHA